MRGGGQRTILCSAALALITLGLALVLGCGTTQTTTSTVTVVASATAPATPSVPNTGGSAPTTPSPPTSPTTPRPPSAVVPIPHIISNPIPFGAERKTQMTAYARRHYGSFMTPTYKLIHPHVIVIHYTQSPIQ
jgi:hypothetical protein